MRAFSHPSHQPIYKKIYHLPTFFYKWVDCLTQNCQIWTLKENYKLGTDIASKVLAFAFGLSAEIERQLISDRTKMSLNKLKAQGKHLGRPFEAKSKSLKLSKNTKKVKDLMAKGLPKAQIARLLGVDKLTLYRFLKKLESEES